MSDNHSAAGLLTAEQCTSLKGFLVSIVMAIITLAGGTIMKVINDRTLLGVAKEANVHRAANASVSRTNSSSTPPANAPDDENKKGKK